MYFLCPVIFHTTHQRAMLAPAPLEYTANTFEFFREKWHSWH